MAAECAATIYYENELLESITISQHFNCDIAYYE